MAMAIGLNVKGAPMSGQLMQGNEGKRVQCRKSQSPPSRVWKRRAIGGEIGARTRWPAKKQRTRRKKNKATLRRARADQSSEEGGGNGKGEGGGGKGWWRRLAEMATPPQFLRLGVQAAAVLLAGRMLAMTLAGKGTTAGPKVIQVPYSQFLQSVNTNRVESVHVDGHHILWKPRQDAAIQRHKEKAKKSDGNDEATTQIERQGIRYSTTRPADVTTPYDKLAANGAEFGTPDAKRPRGSRMMTTFIVGLYVLLILAFVGRLPLPSSLPKRGPGQGPWRGTSVQEESAKATFDDVAGVEDAKEELKEIVDCLKNPRAYAAVGARAPKGVLLMGRPGTGKTLMARAVAGEANVPFISVSASEFVELYVGMGAARVREIFQRAKSQSPCVVFIDELDAVAKGRGEGRARGMGNDEREQTLNQLLTELDGFDPSRTVIVLAATNRPDTIDPALTRPGRFDRPVSVELPSASGRLAILSKHVESKRVPLHTSVDLASVAASTSGFSGAGLSTLVNEAALLAARRGKGEVAQEELEDAVLRSVAGIEKKGPLVGRRERSVVATHEAGHAVVESAVNLARGESNRPQQVSIIARQGGALGLTYTPPEAEDRTLLFVDELRGKLVSLLGGRAAEEVSVGRITSGAADDIRKATYLAYESASQYGFSQQVGPLSVPLLDSGGGEDGATPLGGSAPSASADAEREARSLVAEALDSARKTLLANMSVLQELASLVEREERVSGDSLSAVLSRVQAPDSLRQFLDASPIVDIPSAGPSVNEPVHGSGE